MAVTMLVFDYRENEKGFFEIHNLENFDIKFFEESLNEETLKNLPPEIIDNTSVISVFIDSEVTENVINSFKNLRIISTRSTGIDHINKKAAEAKNISVVNVEGYGSRSVAQYTMGLILALVRKIIPASKYIVDKQIPCGDFTGRDVSLLTIGIIGTGSIGAAVAKLAKAFGMRILVNDMTEKQELINNYDVNYVALNTLLQESDIVTLHIPYTGGNYHLLSSAQFAMMKKTAYVINTSRGEILDTIALYNALEAGEIQGAALDVLTCEYLNFHCADLSEKLSENFECAKEAEIVKKLVLNPNVIITPHIAYETQDAINYILDITIKAILDCIKGGTKYIAY